MSGPAAIRRTLPLYKRGRTPAETIEAYSMPVTECGCWIWLGSGGDDARYGSTKLKGVGLVKAHRLSWFAFRGQIPNGLHVLHRCDTPLCVNPDHLFLGTQLENAADREAKGRGNQPSGLRNGRYTKPWRTARGEQHYCYGHSEFRQGEKNGRAKITTEDVLVIRASTMSQQALGRIFGITKTTVRNIQKRKLWSHVP